MNTHIRSLLAAARPPTRASAVAPAEPTTSTPTRRAAPPPRRLLALAALFGLLASVVLAQTPLPDDFNPGANDEASAFAIQTDGRVLVGGKFTVFGGQARNCIARVNSDGSLDDSFDPGANAQVAGIAIQPDGKILLVGEFTIVGGQTRNRLARLHPDGSLDTAFNPGANGIVYCLALQPDGGIVIGGSFTSVAGQTRNRLARLDATGALDLSFSPDVSATGWDSWVFTLAIQTDGKILVGGGFARLGGASRYCFGRLNSNGTVDLSFNPNPNSTVAALAVQPDGKILVGGLFTTIGGQARGSIVRLSSAGAVDASFNASASNWVFSIAVQVDGNMVVGGDFTAIGGQPRDRLAQLTPGGAVLPSFTAGANQRVAGVTLQQEGRLLVGGLFTNLAGLPRDRIARLMNTGTPTNYLAYEGGSLTWVRNGPTPEVSRTTFEATLDGLNWTNLGAGTRVSNTWILTGLTLPTNTVVRARGFTSAGLFGSSRWFVESYATNAPAPPPAPVLSLDSVAGAVYRFKITGGTNAAYAVQTATSLPPPLAWEPVATLTLTNGWSVFQWTNVGEPARFFRAVGQ